MAKSYKDDNENKSYSIPKASDPQNFGVLQHGLEISA